MSEVFPLPPSFPDGRARAPRVLPAVLLTGAVLAAVLPSVLDAQNLARNRFVERQVRFGCARPSALERGTFPDGCLGESLPRPQWQGWLRSRIDLPEPGRFDPGWTGATPEGPQASLMLEGAVTSLGSFDLLAGLRVDDDDVRPRLRVEVGTESLFAWGGSVAEPPPMLPGLILSRRPRALGLGGRWDLSFLSVGGALANTDEEGRWYLDGHIEGRYRGFAVTARRGTLFDDRPGEPITLRRVLQMLAGQVGVEGKSPHFENSLVSVTAAYRGRPWAGEIEWGTEELSGAYTHVPGLRARLDRWLGTWALATQVTWIDISCCGNPPWYRHQGIAEGWTAQGGLLGSPLGGNGHEVRLELARTDGTLEGAVSLRDRREENVFSPYWEGTSVALEGLVTAGGHWTLLGGLEVGDGWAGGSLGVRGRW